MGFSGFAWERLGIKNPAKSDNLRGCGTVWDCVGLCETALDFTGCSTYHIQLDAYSYGYESLLPFSA